MQAAEGIFPAFLAVPFHSWRNALDVSLLMSSPCAQQLGYESSEATANIFLLFTEVPRTEWTEWEGLLVPWSSG